MLNSPTDTTPQFFIETYLLYSFPVITHIQGHPRVTEKLKSQIKEWAVSFKDDPQLR